MFQTRGHSRSPVSVRANPNPFPILGFRRTRPIRLPEPWAGSCHPIRPLPETRRIPDSGSNGWQLAAASARRAGASGRQQPGEGAPVHPGHRVWVRARGRARGLHLSPDPAVVPRLSARFPTSSSRCAEDDTQTQTRQGASRTSHEPRSTQFGERFWLRGTRPTVPGAARGRWVPAGRGAMQHGGAAAGRSQNGLPR